MRVEFLHLRLLRDSLAVVPTVRVLVPSGVGEHQLAASLHFPEDVQQRVINLDGALLMVFRVKSAFGLTVNVPEVKSTSVQYKFSSSCLRRPARR